MAGSSEPAFLFLDIKMELLLHRLSIYFATAPFLKYFLLGKRRLSLFKSRTFCLTASACFRAGNVYAVSAATVMFVVNTVFYITFDACCTFRISVKDICHSTFFFGERAAASHVGI